MQTFWLIASAKEEADVKDFAETAANGAFY